METIQNSTFADLTFEQRSRRAREVAEQLYEQKPSWLVFFREILGVGGAIHQLFAEPDDLLDFETTAEYREVQQMLGQLRQGSVRRNAPVEPTRVITVRLPKSVHEAIQAEATARKTSMNRLCISKLLQVLEHEFQPPEKTTADDTVVEGTSDIL